MSGNRADLGGFTAYGLSTAFMKDLARNGRY